MTERDSPPMESLSIDNLGEAKEPDLANTGRGEHQKQRPRGKKGCNAF